ncbi:MAG: hypothetical protein GY821_04810 [Gammaproteobacteria bacterium]|nr:hypothetical protein [Gammaproteobacteria bacterium]
MGLSHFRLDNAKYYYNGPENWYFYDGSRFAISPIQVVPTCNATKITNWQVDSLNYIINGHVFCNGGDETFQYSGSSNNAGMSYLGILKITNGYVDNHKEVDRATSPFYFTAYSPR